MCALLKKRMKALLRLCKGDAEAVIFTVICLQYLQKVYRLLISLILEGTVIRYKNFENKKKTAYKNAVLLFQFEGYYFLFRKQ